ncbi:hypothetical protein ACFPM0_01770 [Pseudonocardia sulfidoxydans]|uniref:hypothetical protein n=1 Tax=Pseudonocardia sulfidoxydans TaxID=54011 RepID=UPI00361162A7
MPPVVAERGASTTLRRHPTPPKASPQAPTRAATTAKRDRCRAATEPRTRFAPSADETDPERPRLPSPTHRGGRHPSPDTARDRVRLGVRHCTV